MRGMPTIVHGFDWPDRFVVGTVGQPGSRSFYLQARDGRRLVSVALEKEQTQLLASEIDELLDQLMATEGNRWSVPESTPDELVDDEPLEQPVESEFRTGAMSLGWDPATAQIVIEAFPLEDVEAEDDDEPIGPPSEPSELFQVRIPVGTARAFAQRSLAVVSSGRPTCPLCGAPMEPEGHICVIGE